MRHPIEFLRRKFAQITERKEKERRRSVNMTKWHELSDEEKELFRKKTLLEAVAMAELLVMYANRLHVEKIDFIFISMEDKSKLKLVDELLESITRGCEIVKTILLGEMKIEEMKEER